MRHFLDWWFLWEGPAQVGERGRQCQPWAGCPELCKKASCMSKALGSKPVSSVFNGLCISLGLRFLPWVPALIPLTVIGKYKSSEPFPPRVRMFNHIIRKKTKAGTTLKTNEGINCCKVIETTYFYFHTNDFFLPIFLYFQHSSTFELYLNI